MGARRIYFDNAATTPLDGRVLAPMSAAFTDLFGNPSSLHVDGRQAREAVDVARARVAALLGAKPAEICFTSGGTESNNLAIRGIVGSFSTGACHLITTAIEHPSVLEVCRSFSPSVVQVTRLPVGRDGIVDPDDLHGAITPETRLISIMAANNVIGTLQPISECGWMAHEYGIPFHVDATQAIGKIPVDVNRLQIDLLSFSAHKLYGPKGAGALFIREGTPFSSLIRGGGQEQDRRSGTENVPGIVGLGAAAELCRQEMAEESARIVQLRQRLTDRLLETVPEAYLIGHRYRRLPGLVCLGFDGLEGQAIRLMLALDEAGISVSTGSACSANRAAQPSHVLTAMGFDPLRARGSLRVSLGRFSTGEEVDLFVELLAGLVRNLRRDGVGHPSSLMMALSGETLP
jgi:cysteine desulfurase